MRNHGIGAMRASIAAIPAVWLLYTRGTKSNNTGGSV